MHASADLPIRSDAELNWKKDLKTLTNKANKEIYYWDILTLLTPQPMVFPRNNENMLPDKERLYELRNSGASDDEFALILQGLYAAAIGLPLHQINRYMRNAIKYAENLSHKKHIQRLQRITQYMFDVTLNVRGNGTVEGTHWEGEDPVFMKKIIAKTRAMGHRLSKGEL